MRPIILTMVAFCSLQQASVAQRTDTCLIGNLRNAVRRQNTTLFLETLSTLEKDPLTFQRCSANEGVLHNILSFHKELLHGKINDSLFIVHVQVTEFMRNNAEYSELLQEDFSSFFVRNIPESLKALDKIKDATLLQKIVRSACYKEGSGARVLRYLKKREMQGRPYYEYFVRLQ